MARLIDVHMFCVAVVLAGGSISAQVDWREDSSALRPSGAGRWDGAEVSGAAVLLRDGEFWMWYTGLPAADRGPSARADMGLTISGDPSVFASAPVPLEGLKPASWKPNGVYHCALVEDPIGGDYPFTMWYSGWRGGEPGGSVIGMARSPDGIEWEEYPFGGNPPQALMTPTAAEGAWIGNPAVVRLGENFHLWYDMAGGIGHATSGDGIGWTRDPANPVIQGWDLFGIVVVHDPAAAVFDAWFNAGLRVLHATSLDGSLWSVHGPVSIEGQSGNVGQPEVVREGDLFHLWYSVWTFGWTEIRHAVGERTTPVASFSITPAGGPAPLEVGLDASRSAPAPGEELTSYWWEFGDGEEDEGLNAVVRHAFQEPGEYQVRLTVSDTSGNVSTGLRKLTVESGKVERRFRRGDANGSDGVDLSDAIFILGFLFLGEPTRLDCEDSADANDSGVLDLSDSIYLLSHLFLGGPPPGEPFQACDTDPTGDTLSCAAFKQCQ